jgi:hypothetical protein
MAVVLSVTVDVLLNLTKGTWGALDNTQFPIFALFCTDLESPISRESVERSVNPTWETNSVLRVAEFGDAQFRIAPCGDCVLWETNSAAERIRS